MDKKITVYGKAIEELPHEAIMEVRRLRARIAELEADGKKWRGLILKATEENARFREALEFYADEEIYENGAPICVRLANPPGVSGPVGSKARMAGGLEGLDCGLTAREALEARDEVERPDPQ